MNKMQMVDDIRLLAEVREMLYQARTGLKAAENRLAVTAFDGREDFKEEIDTVRRLAAETWTLLLSLDGKDKELHKQLAEELA